MTAVVQQYKAGSRSAKALAEGLGIKRLKMKGSKFIPNQYDWVINWGSPIQRFDNRFYLNLPSCVSDASNKLKFFIQAEGHVNIPPFTEDSEEARDWVEKGDIVLARTLLRASEGRGIHILNEGDDMIKAPLYTKYMKKRDEFRVHVFKREVIHVQQKRRRRGEENVNEQVRNHGNGWVFTIQDVDPHYDVLSQACLALDVLGLDFGAVDIIWNEFHQKATVLEVNTAPGLEGTTLEKYLFHFSALLYPEAVG